MRHILSTAYREIVDFGQRSLTMTDLSRECDARGISLFEVSMTAIHGLAWSNEGHTSLCINKNLYPEAKLLAGFHELGHHLLHIIDQQMRRSRGRWTNDDKMEAEADAVAVIALMPRVPDDPDTNLEWARVRLYELYGV